MKEAAEGNLYREFIRLQFQLKLFCELCIYGKYYKFSYIDKNYIRVKVLLVLVYSDLCGFMLKLFFGGVKYFFLFIDDWSRFTVVYCLVKKFQILELFRDYFVTVQRQISYMFKIFRTDGGGEYGLNVFRQFCKELGIFRQFIVFYILK